MTRLSYHFEEKDGEVGEIWEKAEEKEVGEKSVNEVTETSLFFYTSQPG